MARGARCIDGASRSKRWLTRFSPSLQTAERAGNCFGCRKREGPCHSVGHGVPAKLSAGFAGAAAAAASAGHHVGPAAAHPHYNGYPLNGAAAAAAAAASVVGYYHGGGGAGGWGSAPVPPMNKS